MAQIDAFFKLMNDEGASDLHMVAGQQPVLRIRGEMERVKFKELSNEELKAMTPHMSQNTPGSEIPEKSWMYRFAKKNWFFGFGAYG